MVGAVQGSSKLASDVFFCRYTVLLNLLKNCLSRFLLFFCKSYQHARIVSCILFGSAEYCRRCPKTCLSPPAPKAIPPPPFHLAIQWVLLSNGRAPLNYVTSAESVLSSILDAKSPPVLVCLSCRTCICYGSGVLRPPMALQLPKHEKKTPPTVPFASLEAFRSTKTTWFNSLPEVLVQTLKHSLPPL